MPGQSFPLESKKNLKFKLLWGERILASRGPDGIRGLHLDGKSIVRSGSSIEENRACKSCRIFGLKNACISFFCFRANWSASWGILKLDINQEESYLLIETDRKKELFQDLHYLFLLLKSPGS